MVFYKNVRIVKSYFLLTAFIVVFGIILETYVSANREGGYFGSQIAKSLNLFAYFTIQSNIIIGITSLLLVVKPKIRNNLFWGLRLSGLISIIITFIIQHKLLSKPIDDNIAYLSDLILHTIVPIMAVFGWLVFGPRGYVTWKIIRLGLIFPVAWLAFTFIRGAITNWYPYDFLNTANIGYIKSATNVAGITILFFIFALIAKLSDRMIAKR